MLGRVTEAAERTTEWIVGRVRSVEETGISQPRLNNMLRGRIDSFSLDMLTKLACRAGLKVEMKLRKAA